MSHVFTTEPLFALASADGWNLSATDGTRLLDLTSGWNVTNAGWSRAEIETAWSKQSETSWFRPSWCDHEYLDLLHERMASLAPGRRLVASCSGSEAVDNALKIARLVTGRAGVIRFEGAYHGSGTGASLATGNYVPHLAPLWPDAHVLDLPLPGTPGAIERAEAAIREFEEAGALVFESVLTNMGCRTVGEDYLNMLARVCDEFGIVTIADEIGTGMNRLGHFFSALAPDLGRPEPDIVVTAKALTNGLYPLSLCLVRERLAIHVEESMFASTYAAMPSGCAAAVATIDTHIADGLGAIAIETGKVFADALRAETDGIDVVTAVAGQGLELALHLDWRGLAKRDVTPVRLLEELRSAGLFVTYSPGENHLMLMPPLVTPPELLEEAAGTIARVLAGAHPDRHRRNPSPVCT